MINLRTEDEIIGDWIQNDSPLVSISCITYNHGNFIEDAIQGFLAQKTEFPFEILIHDDASTDDTQKIIKKYESKYPNIIKPIYQKENQYTKGYRINYIFNVKRALGKYIALCEGDDYWIDERKLQKQIEIMENDEEISMTFHPVKLVDSDKFTSLLGERFFKKNKYWPKKKLFAATSRNAATSSLIYRKEILHPAPELYLKSPVGDIALKLLMGFKGKIYYIDEYMSVYRINVPGSSTLRVNYNEEKYIARQRKYLQTLEDFNNYTNKKFNQQVNIMLYNVRRQIVALEKGIEKDNTVFNPRYRNIVKMLIKDFNNLSKVNICILELKRVIKKIMLKKSN